MFPVIFEGTIDVYIYKLLREVRSIKSMVFGSLNLLFEVSQTDQRSLLYES